MPIDQSDQQSHTWIHPAITRPEIDRADRPAGVFASYVSPTHPKRVSRKSMFSIYVGLLVVAAAFGVFAAYQWERGKQAGEQAARALAQSAALAQRVKELESLGDGLAGMVDAAYEGAPHELLAHLDAMEERQPDAAATEIFTKLWISAKDRERQAGLQDGAPFETASGPAPIASEPNADPQPDPKAEPAVQDRAKGDPVPFEPAQAATPAAQATRDSASSDDAVEIAIAAKQESWIQIVDANGAPIFTRLMKPGDQHMVTPGAGTTLITGNPAGLALSVDGVTAPSFQEKGPTRRQIMLDPQRLLDGTAERR